MSNQANPSKIDNVSKPRKPYRKPELESLGDLRSLTLGGSPGIGESGLDGTRKPRYKMFTQPSDGITLPDGSILLPDGTIILPGVDH